MVVTDVAYAWHFPQYVYAQFPFVVQVGSLLGTETGLWSIIVVLQRTKLPPPPPGLFT